MEELLTLSVKTIVHETSDASTFILESSDKRPLAYRAGQFLTLILSLNGHEVRRSYSLSSSPEVDENLAITVKRVPNGEASRYLLDHLQVGDTLRALPPTGHFVLAEAGEQPSDLFLIGAGSGITPLYSLLKTALRTQPHRRITLLLSNQSPPSTLFLASLNALAQQHSDRVTILHLWSSEGQRLNNNRLERIISQHLQSPKGAAYFYLCGPSDFMRNVHITLLFMGFHADQIRQEYFVIEPAPAPPLASVPSLVTFQFRGQSQLLRVPAGTYLLTAALAAGIPLPYSCRGGRCSACAAVCRTGKVAMRINDVLTARDQAAGWVLTCTGYAESDEVTLEI